MSKLKVVSISVKLQGVAPIMFDRFIDHSKEDRPPQQKFYLADGDRVVLPAMNLDSFLFSDSGAVRCVEGRAAKNFMAVGNSHVNIDPALIPFTDGKKEIVFNGFDGKRFWIHDFGAPVTKLGSSRIKQPMKKRPVLNPPWFLSFEINMVENDIITPQKLRNWIDVGGIMIGLGTWKPKYGRFVICEWKEK